MAQNVRQTFFLAITALFLSACAGLRYQPYLPCSTKAGYKDEKISETEYRISYYAAHKMCYNDIEKFIRQRAAELCAKGKYRLSKPEDIFNLIVSDDFGKDCSVFEFTTVATCLPSPPVE